MGIRKKCDCVFSGFRAEKTSSQGYTTPEELRVTFENDFIAPFGFDLMDEYNPETSIFTAAQDGVYTVQASVAFLPDEPEIHRDFLIEVLIYLNENTLVADDIEIVPASFFVRPGPSSVSVDTATLLQLNEGDTLRVAFFANIDGLLISTSAATQFQAIRNPSPLKN